MRFVQPQVIYWEPTGNDFLVVAIPDHFQIQTPIAWHDFLCTLNSIKFADSSLLRAWSRSRYLSPNWALLNYVEHREKIQGLDKLEQADVDQFVRPADTTLLVDERMPKSIDPLTLEKVGDVVKQLEKEGINAENMGARVGISRTTARRYLEFLVSRGVVTPNLVYGSIGRPERLYFQS